MTYKRALIQIFSFAIIELILPLHVSFLDHHITETCFTNLFLLKKYKTLKIGSQYTIILNNKG